MSRRRIIGSRRDLGPQYLLITIASFAVTVAATRWYLELTGYPTIGGGELHVAHALWGGLALVAAALLPLLWVGHRSLVLSALLAGIGVGLFIDEVGKFLTTTNDYFFAPAAPIIYGSILLLVLLAVALALVLGLRAWAQPVTTVRVRPVPGLMIMTSAFATGEPFGPRMVPRTWAVVSCAKAVVATSPVLSAPATATTTALRANRCARDLFI